MKFRTWLKAKSAVDTAGFCFAVLYFVFMMSLVIKFGILQYTATDSGLGLHWWLCYYIDYPVSMLFLHVIEPLCSFDSIYFLPEPFDDFQGFVLPSLFYLFFGTAWYYFLPKLLWRTSGYLSDNTSGRFISMVLIFSPVLLYWLEIVLVEVANNISYALPWVARIYVALWVVLFAWLLFRSPKKTRVLWLLILAPIMICHLHEDYRIMITYGL